MFRNAKVGDRVWSIRHCWGTIVEINPNYGCPLRVEFDKCDGLTSFTMDGKEYVDDINPTLFWDEIKFNIPERPFILENELRRLEVVKFTVGKYNCYLYWDNDSKKICYDCYSICQIPMAIYFTEESTMEFMASIRHKKITKEEFFKAYNNVFGGK